MARISKRAMERHDQAEKLLLKDVLTFDDKQFVIEHWLEHATHRIEHSGAFFTPYDLGRAFSVEIGQHSGELIDVCAGIGSLALHVQRNNPDSRFTCVELNPDYVRVGKKIMPDARWITGSVFDVIPDLNESFDLVISNPPFGKVATTGNSPRYKGGDFEFQLIDLMADYAASGLFLLPRESCPFIIDHLRHSPKPENKISEKYKRFTRETGMALVAGAGQSFEEFSTEWKNTNITVEAAWCDYELIKEAKAEYENVREVALDPSRCHTKATQLSLFGELV